jgi:hypothetical protein
MIQMLTHNDKEIADASIKQFNSPDIDFYFSNGFFGFRPTGYTRRDVGNYHSARDARDANANAGGNLYPVPYQE